MNPSKKEGFFKFESVLGQMIPDETMPDVIKNFSGVEEMSEQEIREALQQIGVESQDEIEELVSVIKKESNG